MQHLIIFATGNKGKIREVREIIADDPSVQVLSMREAGVSAEPEETGSTFEENALIKARAVRALLDAAQAGNIPAANSRKPGKEILCDNSGAQITVMSDDSGLEIDALGGEPGIYSARYLGHDTDYTYKMNKILERLKDVPDERRSARFVAAVAAIFPDGTEHVVRGTMEGFIGHEIRGRNGFGYDPFFYLPQFGRTSAEISEEEKNAISHRGKALRAMLQQLRIYRTENKK